MSERVVIGLDLGTSSLKGVAVAPDGRIATRAAASYPTDRRGPGAAEQVPEDWLVAVGQVVEALARVIPVREWEAVGLSAMLPTLVLARTDGTPVAPAVTWEDARAEPEGERLRSAIGGDALYARTGQWVDGRYLLPAAVRLRDVTGTASDPVRILGAKDWLFGRLTGTPATDPSTAAGYGCFDLASGRWDEEVVGAAGLQDASALPPILPATHSAPVISSAATELGLPRGLPVVLGAADSVLAARGLGVVDPGRVAYVTGTSTVILGIAPRVVLDPGHRFLVTPLERPGPVGLEMDLVATGSAIGWLARLFGYPDGTEGEVWRLAGELPPGAAGITFLPYLGGGEQGALWDPELRGSLLGLTLAHDRRALARALLDGLVLESVRCLAVLEEVSGSADELVATGAGVGSSSMVRSLANASGRRVRWPSDPAHPASAWGAATLALEAIGRDRSAAPDLAEGVGADPAARAAWDAAFERHEAARRAIVAARGASIAAR